MLEYKPKPNFVNLYTRNDTEPDNMFSLLIKQYFDKTYLKVLVNMKEINTEQSCQWWCNHIVHHEIHQMLTFLGFNSIIDDRLITTNFKKLCDMINQSEKWRSFLGNGSSRTFVSDKCEHQFFFLKRINKIIQQTYDIKIIFYLGPDRLCLRPVGSYELDIYNNKLSLCVITKN